MQNRNPSVNVHCSQCDYTARRQLLSSVSTRGHHETACEVGFCPKGHGLLKRSDGGSVGEPWADADHPDHVATMAKSREWQSDAGQLAAKAVEEARRKARYVKGQRFPRRGA